MGTPLPPRPGPPWVVQCSLLRAAQLLPGLISKPCWLLQPWWVFGSFLSLGLLQGPGWWWGSQFLGLLLPTC